MLNEARQLVDVHLSSTQRMSAEAKQRLLGEAYQRSTGKTPKEQALMQLRAALKARCVCSVCLYAKVSPKVISQKYSQESQI